VLISLKARIKVRKQMIMRFIYICWSLSHISEISL